MNELKSIQCPVDLSEDSFAAVDLATRLARDNKASIMFLHVALPMLPSEKLFAEQEVLAVEEEDKHEFMQVKPTDPSVPCEHLFAHGNPGPVIVQVARDQGCDMIVLGTHGRSGLLRILMGSVAEYVLRHAHCPVLTLKGLRAAEEDEPRPVPVNKPRIYVTEVMQHVEPIHASDQMRDVVIELESAGATGAPVADDDGKCTGILTVTDIDKYRELKQRYQEKDPSVLDEMFEVDEFGQRRPVNQTFDQVVRHMTQPVITIQATQTCDEAARQFAANPKIHHLVVVNDRNRPLGILEPHQLPESISSA